MDNPLRRALLVVAAVLAGSAAVTACLAYRRSEPGPSRVEVERNTQQRLPPLIQQCEQGAEYHCGTWTLVDAAEGQYQGVWDQGTRADLHVRSFDRDSIEVRRVDRAGPSAGVTALYRGRMRGRSAAEGTVTWSGYGTTHGSWAAKW